MSCEHCTFGTWFLEKIDHRKKAGEVPLVVVVTVCVDEEREKRAKHQLGLLAVVQNTTHQPHLFPNTKEDWHRCVPRHGHCTTRTALDRQRQVSILFLVRRTTVLVLLYLQYYSLSFLSHYLKALRAVFVAASRVCFIQLVRRRNASTFVATSHFYVCFCLQS